MGTLELQVGDGVVFAHYLPANPGPNNGGYLGRVLPGGSFLAIGYDQLITLGTGSHKVQADERAEGREGEEPEYESEWRQLFERFQYSLFMYGVGACVAMEVLAAAREVIRFESQSKQPEPFSRPRDVSE